jgi:GDP-mannose 6-dehydrogenase
MGYVGTVSAACLARMGHEVIGVDSNPAKLELLAGGRSPVIEPGLSDLIAAVVTQGRLAASANAVEAVCNTDISLYCVGTPGNENGSLNLDAVRVVCQSIGDGLRQKTGFHVVVTRSTMLPGTTRSIVLPLLEAASGKKAGVDFGLAVYPEFLREGTALHDFEHPPLVVMASTDARTTRMLVELNPGDPEQVVVTSFEVAEMVKYVNNSWHGVKVAFANEIGSLCVAQGIDSHELMSIFSRDRVLNISPAYLRPGFAFGGSCIPKDLRALDYRARSLDLNCPLLGQVLTSNQAHIERAMKLITAQGRVRVGVLGISFKQDTDDIRESPMITVVEGLLGRGYDIKIFDRNVQVSALVGANREYMLNAIPHINRLIVPRLEDVLEHAQTLVVGHTDAAFDAALRTLGPDKRVVDLVRIRDQDAGLASYAGLCW